MFVPYAPDRRTTRSTTRSKRTTDAGRSKIVGSASADVPGTGGSDGRLDARDDNVAMAAETTRAADTTTAARKAQTSADVLVVDDDADVRWTVAEVLRSAGFSVAEAEDGEIARDMLSTGSYRMVLLDLRMPRRDGVSLIEAVGEVPPVIVHSAYSLDASDRERLGSKVVDYLHKPVSPQKLLRAVEAVLGSGE